MALSLDQLKALAGKPAGVEICRAAVTELAASSATDEARKSMAELAVKFGNYTDEGRAVWSEYLAAGCPKSST